ncbi:MULTISPECIES: ABC transporter ATP-binding protein [Chitinophagaceae]
MVFNFKNNILGYIRFYFQILGYRIVLYLLLNLLVGLMDGFGLTMFIPLLQIAGGDTHTDTTNQSMGGMHYLVSFMAWLHLPLNLTSVLIVLVVLFILKGIFKYIQQLYFTYLRSMFIKRIRHGLINQLEGLSYKGFLELDAGRIQNTFIAEAQKIFYTFTHFFESFQAFVLLATYIAMAFTANYQFAVFVIIGGGLSNIIYQIIYRKLKGASLALSRKGHNFNSFLLQAVTYFKYLKSTGYINRYTQKIHEVVDETEVLNFRMGKLETIMSSLKEPLMIFIVAVVIYIQIHLLHGNLSSIILSLLLFYRSLQYLMNVQTSWQQFLSDSGSMVVVGELWNQMGEYKETAASNRNIGKLEEIRLDNVHFGYGNRDVIKGVSLCIPKNKTVAFVGESGSGKSTLINIITGLLSPQCGELLLNQEKMQTVNIQNYRSRIGFISQDPVVFNDTIYNNITFWAEKNEHNLEHFWHIVEMASLTSFVESSDQKEDSLLGDNGLMASGGQKQRISIARELYKNTEVLILDEATSALDSETENIIQSNIDNLKGHYTIVIIAHRLATIKNADTIYLLNEGRIEAAGDFQHLENSSYKFKRMVELQNL